MKMLNQIVLAALIVLGVIGAMFGITVGIYPVAGSIGLGALVLALISIISGLGWFKGVPEEERWVSEIFGAFHQIVGPGLWWRIPLIEKVRAKVSVWTQKIELFTSPIKIDFLDGSAIPKDAFMFIECNLPDDTHPVVLDGSLSPTWDAPYRMIYAIDDFGAATKQLGENATRSYLNGLSISQALAGGRGGYDITQKMSAGNLDELNGVKKQLALWGLRLIRMTVGDFDLDEAIIKARESVMTAERSAEATKHDVERLAAKAMGSQVATFARAKGITIEEAQQELGAPGNKDVLQEMIKHAAVLVRDQISIDGKAFTRISVEGGEQSGMNLIALLGKMFAGGKESGSDKERKNTPRRKKPEEMTDDELDAEVDRNDQ